MAAFSLMTSKVFMMCDATPHKFSYFHVCWVDSFSITLLQYTITPQTANLQLPENVDVTIITKIYSVLLEGTRYGPKWNSRSKYNFF